MQSTIDFNTLEPTQVLQLIQNSLSGDNQKIKTSTRVLKAYTKHKSSIRTLTYILVNSPQLGHRQMATVLLKRNVVALYSGLGTQEQAEFRGLLLAQYVKENQLLIQRGIATLISMLLPVVEIKNWVQLQQLLDQAIKSAPESAATFVLLNSILYHFKAPTQLFGYVLNALKDPRLAEEAIKCVVSLVQSQDVDPSFAVQFIRIWQQCDWPEEIALIAIEVLNTMIERKIRLADEVTFWVCDRIITNKQLSNKFRTAGCDYLFSFTDYNPKLLASRDQLLKKVVQTACLTCSEPYKHKQDSEQMGEFVQEIALWLVETLAVTLKPKKIYPVLFEAAVALINSEDCDKMNTGFLVLGSACEGCAEKVKRNLPNPIMNVLIPKGLAHPAPEVRGAAINALCYFSQHLVPDIFDYHAVIIPAMMKYIGDLSPKVVSKALIAIDVFFDGMEQEDILQYLPVVIPRLIEVLGSNNALPLMKAAAISAIGSAVTVSELHFQGYLAQVLPVCEFLLKTPPSPQINTVRSENLNVLGKLANVFCKETAPNHIEFYQKYIMKTMEIVYGFLLNETDPEIRESAFAFFYLIANAIGSRFEIVFDQLIGMVISACQPKAPPVPKKNEFSLDSDSQEEQEDIAHQKVTEHDQKAAAIHALGQFAKACPLKFTPYFQTAYKLLDQHYQHFYENIRIQVCHCYTNLTLGLVKSQFGGNLPIVKKGLPCIERYSNQIQELFRTMLIPRLLTVMTQDDDNRVRGAAVESVDDLVKDLGPAFVDKSINPLKEAIMKLLEAEIDQDDDEDQEDDKEKQEEEEDETDVHTFEALCDLIPSLAENLKVGFQPTLAELHPYLLRYLQEREEANDNVQMTGCLSQCFKWVPGYPAAHAEELFRSLAALVPLWNTEINRNVAYCLAEMFEKASHGMIAYLQDGLLLLKQIFDHAGSSQACKDNAVAAICRIIYTLNPPMPHQIFVDNLIQMMPFKGDQQQEGSAIKALIYLSNSNPVVLQPHRQAMIAILENDLSNPKKYHLSEPLLSQSQIFLSRLRN